MNRNFENDDKLRRKEYAKFLENIILTSNNNKRNSENDAYVIALDSPWGTGKTYFIDMFEDYISKKNDIFIIKYSAWKNDFWDNAFEPLMQEIIMNDEFNHQLDDEKLKSIGKSIIKSLFIIGKGIKLSPLRVIAGDKAVADLETELEKGCFNNIKEFMTGDNIVFKELLDFKKNIENFKSVLTQYIDLIGKDKKFVVIIDELDRCKPTFSIQTLEIVKHIFDIPNMIFLFALDMEQLSHSIKCVYGQGMDSFGYLCRFFDYISRMPKPSVGNYIKDYYKDLATQLSQCESILKDDKLKDFTVQIYDYFKLSLRDLDTILQNFKIMIQLTLKDYKMVECYCIYLFYMTMKYKGSNVFNNIFIKHNAPFSPENKEWCDFAQNSPYLKESIRMVSSPLLLSEVDLKIKIDKFAKQYSQGEGKIITIKEDKIICTTCKEVSYGGIEYTRNPYDCHGYILFNPDLNHWDDIKNLSYREFLHQKLEMYNFINEDDFVK